MFLSRVRITRASHRHGKPSLDEQGQSLVEFAIILPIFLILIVGMMEFSLAFNALLSINFASRDAALLAAEAGSDTGADCVVLQSIESDVGSPANAGRIGQVRVYWSDVNGVERAANVWNRIGSTSCTFIDGSTFVVPYTLSAAGYPESARCDVVAGCGGGHTGVDTVGVSITYTHSWITPIANMLSLSNSGYTFTHSNAMRMEPVL